MIRALLSFLWDGIPARFVSDYDLAESVRRLTLAALGLALVAAGRAQATPDAAWLSALIQRALRAPPAAEAAATHHRNQAP